MSGLLLVIDPAGDAFTALRKAFLDIAIWRSSDVDAQVAGDVRLAVIAVPPMEWDHVAAASARLTTVVATASWSEEHALRAIAAGASGYINLQAPLGSLRRAIAAALRGELVYSRHTLANGIRANISVRARSWAALTPRQREVLALISQGATDKQIAATLRIAPATAQKHASNLVRRLGVPNRAAAVANAASG